MIRPAILAGALVAIALAMPAAAADRTIGIGSFARLRVDGPFDVRVDGGGSPRATLSGDRDAIDAVEIRLDGGTLVVRGGVNVWGERRGNGGGPVVVTLATPALASVAANAGARVAVTAMKGDRVELSAGGASLVTVAGVQAGDLNAALVGSGGIVVAGRAARARLIASGAGQLDAAGLDVGDALIRLEGPGAIKARVRYTAQVANTGLGAIEVAGPATCDVRGAASGPVRCEGPRK